MSVVSEPENEPGFFGRIDRAFDRAINGWNPYHPNKLADRGLDPVEIEESRVRRSGSRLVIIAMIGFFAWAVFAPIDSGVNMTGTVTIAGYRKAVQHPTGGIVQKVFVNEGDKVKQGQVLLRINPLQTEAEVSNLSQEYINLLVSESRAKAELLNRPIVWDRELNRFNQQEVAESKQIQQRIYDARRQQTAEQMRGLTAQIGSLQGTISSHRVQQSTLTQELKATQDLAAEGFVPKQQVNVILRNKVDQDAALNSAQSEVGKVQAQMAEFRSQRQNEIAKELAELQKGREAISSKLAAAQFSQSLSEIRAPIDGTVVNLKVFTEGGVIRGGDILMEVVPSHGALIIDTKVPPKSIDRVVVGQEADLRFVSFNASRTPVVRGKVKSVGIDKLRAEPGQEVNEKDDFYLATVEATPEAMAVLGNKQLRPGMPVDVIVKGGQRTFMAYLLKPLTDKIAGAFKD